ncbi:MAG: A/G-specific adenine glycosylase [Phototrophicaceae bacterium]
MSSQTIATHLLDWFRPQARDLPWRHSQNPYTVWLSEVMLQQTQIETVLPYYTHFVTKYPTVHLLAQAPLDDVLKMWEGLGYYSRARHLHQTAQIISNTYGGNFPTTPEQLMTLPGIGRYTASAIASIAYGYPSAVLDGNVMRVLARLDDLAEDITDKATQARLWERAQALLPSDSPGDYNQAIMELGQKVCRPATPHCGECPLQAHCLAFAHNTQAIRPVKTKKPPTPHYDVAAAMVWDDAGRVLIAQRPLEGLLGGLWEFPGGKQEAGESLSECVQRELREELAIEVEVLELFTVVKHAFTHFKITLHAFTCRYRPSAHPPQKHGVQDYAWVHVEELARYSFGKADRVVIEELHNRRGMLL